jgi:hypothetical protein
VGFTELPDGHPNLFVMNIAGHADLPE